MDQTLYQNHLEILKEELLVALGCTAPMAIAYAGGGLVPAAFLLL